MSIESLIDDEPPTTVQRQAKPGETDANGIPLQSLVNIRQTQGRFSNGSAQQIKEWLSLGIEANYAFITKDGDIQNGMFLLNDDGRLFRVTGTGQKRYTKGNIPTYWNYPCQEQSAT